LTEDIIKATISVPTYLLKSHHRFKKRWWLFSIFRRLSVWAATKI